MAECASTNCACPLPTNARFCPRCGRKVRASNTGWLFMAFGVLLMVVIGLMIIRFESGANGIPHAEPVLELDSEASRPPLLSRPQGNFWRP